MDRKKILSEALQLKALAVTMIEKATHLEKLLAGEGKPAGTRKGLEAKVAKVLAHMNKNIKRENEIL